MKSCSNIPAEAFREMLANELERRRRVNPRYSLRSLARQAGVSPSVISEILNGKRRLSRRSAETIAANLFPALEEQERFVLSALGVEPRTPPGPAKRLDLEAFACIAEWYHLAILSLARITPNSASVHWIARRLGITPEEAEQAFIRLEKRRLIARKGRGFVRTEESFSVDCPDSSAAIRQYHRGNLEKALQSLQNDPPQQRDMSAVTMAIDPRHLPKARLRIEAFRREMSEILEEGQPQQVYTFALQLFPVSQPKDGPPV